MKFRLNKEEREFYNSLKKGEWVTLPDFPEEKKRFEEAARVTLHKSKRVNLRLSEKDFYNAKVRAIEEGLPYQTLLASVIFSVAWLKRDPVDLLLFE